MAMNCARRLRQLFIEKGFTLSVAESCTGGLICDRLTAVAGASGYMKAGIVAYSPEAKRELLGIPQRILSTHGLVSEETARQMAKRIRRLTRTDFSVATTGNLGPGVLEGSLRGLVYIAVGRRQCVEVRRFLLSGSRKAVKEQAAEAALRFLLEAAGNG